MRAGEGDKKVAEHTDAATAPTHVRIDARRSAHKETARSLDSPVARGVKKDSRQGKEADLGGKKAKAGTKGNPRRLHAHGSGKMVGVVVAAKATVGMKMAR